MDPQKLAPLIQTIKDNPEDIWSWMQLGDIAKAKEEWDTAISAYTAAVRIRPDNEENITKFFNAREKYIEKNQREGDFLNLKILKLPRKTSVILLVGILNTKIETLQANIKALVSNFDIIVLDFTGVSDITGLGPSCLRNMCTLVEEKGKKFILANTIEKVQSMLAFKGIEITTYPDLPEIFQEM